MNPSQVPPFYELQALPFQELCLDVVKVQKDVKKATIYGTNGQAQRGTDVLAELLQGGVWLVQCKAHQTFDEKKLTATTGEFWEHYEFWKAQGVRRFTVAVGCGIADRKVLDKMHDVRRRFVEADLVFDLWDSRDLRDLLSPNPGVVTRHCKEWLEHICGKKLSYLEDKDMQGEGTVIPKELRSYDEHDAAFFLRLVPGPKDAAGIPESVRFWASRLNDPKDTSFTVGLIWGPSGCGKSSFVRAGIIPILHQNVLPIRIEADLEETVVRLQSALLRECPIHSDQTTLSSIIEGLAAGKGLPVGVNRVVLILDQFEEWLQGFRADKKSELVVALRKVWTGCRSVRVLLVVRHDFRLQATRLFKEINVELDSKTNVDLIDAFEPPHAEQVLCLFHEAYGKGTQIDPGFLRKAIDELKGEHGRIVPVRLCVFAAYMASRAWTVATLDQVGGVDGIGRRFLQDKIERRPSTPTLSIKISVAKCILESLLPDRGSLILRPARSLRYLIEKCGRTVTSEQVETLCGILDSELHLITPVEFDAMRDTISKSVADEATDSRAYRLTHDYLVKPLQGWLSAEQTQTFRGRMRLRLKDFGARWHRWPDESSLPRMITWIGLQLFTSEHERDEDETALMKNAMRLYLNRLLISAVVFVVGLTIVGVFWTHWRVRDFITDLQSVETQYVPDVLNGNRLPYSWVRQAVSLALQNHEISDRSRYRLNLARLRGEPGAVNIDLANALLRLPLTESLLIRDQLKQFGGDLDSVNTELRNVMLDTANAAEVRLKAVSALAVLTKGELVDVPDDLGAELVSSITKDPQSMVVWIRAFGSQKPQFLMPAIEKIFRDPRSDPLRLAIATDLLKSFNRADRQALADLIRDARPSSLGILVEALRETSGNCLDLFPETSDVNLGFQEATKTEDAVRRAANSAIARAEFGDNNALYGALELDSDPRIRTIILQHLLRSSRSTSLVDALNPDASNGRLMALVAIAGCDAAGTPSKATRDIVNQLFIEHPDAGVHSYCEWALRKWRLLDPHPPGEFPKNRSWFISKSGQSMAILQGGEFRMGAAMKGNYPGDEDRERQHQVMIERTFAIATHEVTFGEFRKFTNLHNEIMHEQRLRHGNTDNHPVNNVSWYDAMQYCNYLNELEGIPEAEWPFPKGFSFDPMKSSSFPSGYLERTGYRLPTEAEWEYACRAGTSTSRYFDDTGDHMDFFTRNIVNSQGESMAVVGTYFPNAFGMFDMLGNALEWCLEPKRDYP